MIFIKSPYTNPFFNLAAEEYLFTHSSEEIIMLWKSTPSVIIGKHQNGYAEINYPYLRENNIAVARRISGGGTVFLDMGNLNFTFIQQGSEGNMVNFKRFLEPVKMALNKIDLPVILGEKNTLLLKGKKISGNAEHVIKNRVLHHGTLLFQSNLDVLNESIEAPYGKYKDKAVQSNRSEVINCCEYLPEHYTMELFEKALQAYFFSEHPELHQYNFNDQEIYRIEKKSKEKFSTWEWIFGYSPPYTFENILQLNSKTFEIRLKVEKGNIVSCELQGTLFSKDELQKIEKVLLNIRHKEENITQIVNKQPAFFSLTNREKEHIILGFFY